MNPPTYGLSEDTMKALGITLPITSRIRVKNLAYGVNEAKLREVFSLSGKMIEATLHRNEDGEPKGPAAIEYAHPLGAVQCDEDIQRYIDEVNKDLTQPEKIKKFIFIDEPFSIENNLMTPTMKVRRHEVQKKYQNQIDQLF